MKFHYAGKYSGDPESLQTREHEPGNVPFKEPDPEKLPIIINAAAFLITVVLIVPVIALSIDRIHSFLSGTNLIIVLAAVLFLCFGSLILIFPHEFLHGLCFRGDVYMYTNMKQGMCFVVGPELFSKARFVFMCMLPNLVFGIIPYILWIVFSNLWYLGLWGAMAVGMGAGDYLNVFNCLTQMPKGAKTYMHGMSSFWVR